ncbi:MULTISPECIES: tetratricopeptide repeat protein [unclassified Schlesneria]|uniref:tetratricopeptide repeat protein n=1 Tax=unclassified Schlesneria TaxID=2762017 RepID=UPI002EEDD847
MRRLFRRTLNVALVLAPFLGNGCATHPLRVDAPQQEALHDPQKAMAQQMLVAQREEARGHLSEARKLYTRIHQANPDNAECAHRLGLLYVKMNLHNEAEVFYNKALELKPDDSKILADIGHLAFLKKEYAKSEEYLARATSADSSNRTAAYNLAVVRAWMEDDEGSLATFRQFNAEHDALRNLAAVQIARGDKGAGHKSMRMAEIAAESAVQVAAAPVDPTKQTAPIKLPAPEAIKQDPPVIAARSPELSNVPVRLKPIPEPQPPKKLQPAPQTSNAVAQVRQVDPADIPPAPAILPSQSASALAKTPTGPRTVARIEPPVTTTVAHAQSPAVIVIPASGADDLPELLDEAEELVTEEEIDETQFELPHRSSVQIEIPEREKLSWESLKRIEIMNAK